MRKISTDMHYKICFLSEQGHSQANISRRTGVSRCAEQAFLKKMLETGKVEDRKRSGRPKKLTRRDEHYLRVMALKNRTSSSTEHAANLALHSFTVRRALIRNNLHGWVATRNPLLRKDNKSRYFYAKKSIKLWDLANGSKYCGAISQNLKSSVQIEGSM